jgi:hypothetical protein
MWIRTRGVQTKRCKGTMQSGIPGIETRGPVGECKTMCECDMRDSDSPALLFIPLHKWAL